MTRKLFIVRTTGFDEGYLERTLHDPAQYPLQHAFARQFPKCYLTIQSCVIYLPRSKFGYENIIMHRSNGIVFKPNFLTALRDPLDVTTIHCRLEENHLACTIRMFKCSMGITLFLLCTIIFLALHLEFKCKGVKVCGCRLPVRTN